MKLPSRKLAFVAGIFSGVLLTFIVLAAMGALQSSLVRERIVEDLLALKLRAEAFQEANGNWPSSIDELVASEIENDSPEQEYTGVADRNLIRLEEGEHLTIRFAGSDGLFDTSDDFLAECWPISPTPEPADTTNIEQGAAPNP